ncbi:Resistance protein [Arachis hypogaea]|nr:Resistance protein [Arachis hypogaea]
MEGARSNQKQDKVVEEDMVGFVNIFNDVTKQSKGNDSCVDVLSIIGMGGLGLQSQGASSKPSEGLSESTKGEAISEDYQKSKVQKFLAMKKYLIVLDDI